MRVVFFVCLLILFTVGACKFTGKTERNLVSINDKNPLIGLTFLSVQERTGGTVWTFKSDSIIEIDKTLTDIPKIMKYKLDNGLFYFYNDRTKSYPKEGAIFTYDSEVLELKNNKAHEVFIPLFETKNNIGEEALERELTGQTWKLQMLGKEYEIELTGNPYAGIPNSNKECYLRIGETSDKLKEAWSIRENMNVLFLNHSTNELGTSNFFFVKEINSSSIDFINYTNGQVTEFSILRRN
ncbi:MAG: hypothetical protein CL840_13700 [Crocinitomicaceae bacterium]|nr:hypothetical protein [Crocinitomicaceae bacterium]|tara:strand:- start:574 stop:1293 length:720 start_codon:yes stop_codon:yes gene_type:complete